MGEGDQYLRFFHRVASGRKKRNYIEEIVDGARVVQIDEWEIWPVFTEFFLELFMANSELDMEKVVGAMHKTTNEMQCALAPSFTEKDVTKVLFQMHPCKAPVPDGMSAIFFYKFWETV